MTAHIVSVLISSDLSQELPLLSKLFGPLRERYAERNGGYTRMLRVPNREGDNSPMAVVELVDNPLPPLRLAKEELKKKRMISKVGKQDIKDQTIC